MKYLFSLLLGLGCYMAFSLSFTHAQIAPSFEQNFGKFLVNDTPDQFGRVETVFNFSGCISRNFSLKQNIQNLFYPNTTTPPGCSTSQGGLFWDILRGLGGGLLFVYFIRAGMQLVISGSDEEKRTKALKSLLYIIYGGLLFLGSTWILGTVINIGGLQGSEEFVTKLQDGIFLQVLTLLKGLAFFAAIIFLVVYGYKMMAATDQEDKLKSAKTGIVNIVLSLVFIKVIDYLYYIASIPSFGSDAGNFIIEVAKMLGYIVGAAFMLSLFYLGFLLLTGRGEEETVTKVKHIAVTIVLSALVLFLFLLIIYQVLQEIG